MRVASGAAKSHAKALSVVLFVIASAYVSVSTARPAWADDGEAIFKQKCEGCHSIGQGKRVGPDLKDVTTRRDRSWIAGYIIAPDKVRAQGDPIAKQLQQEYGMQMPNLGVSEKDAEALVSYLEKGTAGAKRGESNEAAREQAAPAATTTADPAAGRALFTGQSSFKNGGAACISCHNVSSLGGLGGGNVGRDLTVSYAALGQSGLESILRSQPFPIMKQAFANHPMTDAEVANLSAFLQLESGAGKAGQSQGSWAFPAIGAAAFVVIIGLMQLIWTRRLRGVRQQMISGGER